MFDVLGSCGGDHTPGRRHTSVYDFHSGSHGYFLNDADAAPPWREGRMHGFSQRFQKTSPPFTQDIRAKHMCVPQMFHLAELTDQEEDVFNLNLAMTFTRQTFPRLIGVRTPLFIEPQHCWRSVSRCIPYQSIPKMVPKIHNHLPTPPINIAHQLRLLRPFLNVPLVNTQRINPEHRLF
jgi:hypothetical protein